MRKAADHLAKTGYRVVDIVKMDEAGTNRLHVEKEETHDPKSLTLRNAQLTKFAALFGLDSYDGMDVGPIDAKEE